MREFSVLLLLFAALAVSGELNSGEFKAGHAPPAPLIEAAAARDLPN